MTITVGLDFKKSQAIVKIVRHVSPFGGEKAIFTCLCAIERQGEKMQETENDDFTIRRTKALLEVVHSSPLTFDVLEFLSRDLDDKALAIFCGNVSMLPSYMKSSEIPYLSLSRSALGTVIKKSPLSY